MLDPEADLDQTDPLHMQQQQQLQMQQMFMQQQLVQQQQMQFQGGGLMGPLHPSGPGVMPAPPHVEPIGG